jgi:hypothetical protein
MDENSGLKKNEIKTEICVFDKHYVVPWNIRMGDEVIITKDTINALVYIFQLDFKLVKENSFEKQTFLHKQNINFKLNYKKCLNKSHGMLAIKKIILLLSDTIFAN